MSGHIPPTKIEKYKTARNLEWGDVFYEDIM
jgi:hypothetical protein